MREDLIERLREEAKQDGARWEGCSEVMLEAAAALEAAREDAERYRWLRNKDSGDQWRYMGGLSREAMDAAIDQARGNGVAE